MLEKLTVFRAVSSHFARRMIRRVTILVLVVLVILLGMTWVLAYYLSEWLWLLLIPIIGLALAFVIVRTIASFVARQIYNRPVPQEDQADISKFVDKLERLLEQRQVTPPLIAMISVKDLVVHRELRTVKTMIEDTRTLKSDYQDLDKKLNLK